jgi:hypothetical protein
LAQLLTFEEAPDAKGDNNRNPEPNARDWMMTLYWLSIIDRVAKGAQ